MSNEQENFEKLRLLLSIKRHEQPPPGYFYNLSREIVARIQAGEAQAAPMFLGWHAPWLRRLWAALDAKPVLAGSLGVAVCGLLLTALAFNIAPETEPESAMRVEHMLAGNFTPATEPVHQAGLVTLSVLGGSSLFATGGVTSLAPQFSSPGRHPYGMTVGGFQ